MVKIILILALLQYIYNFIFGYKSNIMSCGIFGQATDDPKNLDVNGVHILGIYNIERGKMSCGLSWDGDVMYGMGVDKLYTDFIIDREIKPVKTPIMIGHTRQPSYGFAITEENAHPFGFGTSKDGESYEMIFCHNGTLKNHKELAKKYNIDLTEKIKKISHGGHEYETTRDKIDSEILGEILYRTKKFNVLSEYVGAAALAWTWIDEPNKLYLWSGASKQTKDSAIITETEERPMNVYSESKNSMFFSSLKNSLIVLGASKKDDLQIDYNTVYIITDGDFVNAKKHKVSRQQACQNETASYNNKRYFNQNNNYCDWDNYEDVREKEITSSFTTNNVSNTLMINLQNDKPIEPIINYGSKIYSKSLRYWKQGQTITGIYYYIKGWGFSFAGVDALLINDYIATVKGKTFNLQTGGFDANVAINGYVPFKKNVENIQLHYFINGVLLKTLQDYKQTTILNNGLKYPNKRVTHYTLSYISKHPVINIDIVDSAPVAIFEGVPFTGNITELGFEKVYYFNHGILTKWVKREDLSSILELPPITSQTTIPSKEDTYLESDFISEIIIESFEKHSEDIEETIIELSNWKHCAAIKIALNTLGLINHTLKGFTENTCEK